ncbi:MAG: hypothetical protein GY820_21665 [Gammaproteobacteria bacterium]|nr:hypothetical protein [Gammaproteobacteria bacterium]
MLEHKELNRGHAYNYSYNDIEGEEKNSYPLSDKVSRLLMVMIRGREAAVLCCKVHG